MNNFRKISRNSCRILKTFLRNLTKTLVVLTGTLWVSLLSSTDTPTMYHHELGCIQELLFYEARGTHPKGMQAVARVLQNRTNLKGFPSSYCEVSKQRFQFSYHLDKHKQQVNLSPYSLDTAAFALAGTTARDTLEETLVAPFKALESTNVAYYHTHEVKPSWAKRLKVVYEDKFHIFYKK